jgi:cytoskeletal protein CcmA (bactofilin family)
MSSDQKNIFQEKTLARTASRLGQTISVDGNLTGHEDLELQGNFSGQIDLALHDVTIQKTAKVKAEVKAKNLFLFGDLEGNIRAERVVISDTGNYAGDILTCKISIQNGAKFKGTIKISKDYKL